MTKTPPGQNADAPAEEDRVRYRCPCGHECLVSRTRGGGCPNCGRKFKPDVLRYDLSATIDLHAPLRASAPLEVAETATDLPKNQIERRGSYLGHFEIIDLLGQGGMARVYRALDRSLQRYVAVKVLKSKPSGATSGDSDGSRDRLMQEAIAQARVNHPHIVAIYYVGHEAGKRFMAMELVPGEALNARLARTGPLKFSEVVSIALQIASALQASARLDLIHGDVKPSNILLQDNGVAKLSDFGLARCASGPSRDGWGGTPNYLAPELLTGTPPSIQSDMYSLGVTLFELSFGRLPRSVSASSVADWADALSRQPIQFPVSWPDHLPRQWAHILNRLLNPNPQSRYPNYESLLADLYAIMPVTPQSARIFPRLFALIIDYFIATPLIVLSLLIVFFLLGETRSLLSITEPLAMRVWRSDLPWYLDIVNLALAMVASAACVIAPLAYLAWVGYWRQSPGRALMHLRIVNRHGLRPRGRQVALRESVRLMMALSMLPVALGATWGIPLLPLASISAGLALFVSLFDFLVAIISRDGRSLHDRIFQTRVVLDTE